MLRNEWKFDYTAARIAEAAVVKIAYHKERLAYWKAKREEVLQTIRSEGIEIDEKIVLAFRNPKARDWERGGQVVIRNDLQKDLQEVYDKLAEHTAQLASFDAWQHVLAAHPEDRLQLDAEDWQFFFSSDAQ